MMIYRAGSAVLGAALRVAAPLAGPDWRQRLVLDAAPGVPGAVWLHGASMGELASARPVAEALASRFPVIVTANSITGRDLARGWGLPAALAPLDIPGAVARFLARHRPRLAISVEAEIWPNRSAALARAGIAQAIIGARMSPRSAARWARLPGLIGPVLGRVALASAQDEAAGARLLRLGLRPEVLAAPVNLKLIGPRGVTPPAPSRQRDETLLIASSHEDEEAVLLAGLARLRARRPGLRIIWAPRHPERFAPLARQLPGFARRSAGAGTGAPLLLADSMGEMARWHDAAATALICGSFDATGGHSPWEAAGHGCAILHGPNVATAAADYAALAEAGAAQVVGADWDATVAALPAGRLHAMGQAARAVLDARAGDPAPLLAALAALAATPRKPDMMEVKGASV